MSDALTSQEPFTIDAELMAELQAAQDRFNSVVEWATRRAISIQTQRTDLNRQAEQVMFELNEASERLSSAQNAIGSAIDAEVDPNPVNVEALMEAFGGYPVGGIAAQSAMAGTFESGPTINLDREIL